MNNVSLERNIQRDRQHVAMASTRIFMMDNDHTIHHISHSSSTSALERCISCPGNDADDNGGSASTCNDTVGKDDPTNIIKANASPPPPPPPVAAKAVSIKSILKKNRTDRMGASDSVFRERRRSGRHTNSASERRKANKPRRHVSFSGLPGSRWDSGSRNNLVSMAPTLSPKKVDLANSTFPPRRPSRSHQKQSDNSSWDFVPPPTVLSSQIKMMTAIGQPPPLQMLKKPTRRQSMEQKPVNLSFNGSRSPFQDTIDSLLQLELKNV